MKNLNCDLVVIGGGPAGLAAAWAAKEQGIEDILILEREDRLGGILNQCIHNGFGLHYFGRELTGPEYAYEFIKMIKTSNIKYWLNTTVADIDSNKRITAINQDGVTLINAKAVVLAMGCRERSKGALNIPGTRPSGIFSAGTAQRYVNIEGYMPGKEVIILGSGDIGLIMARRMTLEGAKVKAVVEIMPYSSGLNRNIVQCLDDYNIPLKLSHTVTKIHGKERITGVTISKVDESRRPIEGTEEHIPCDTLLLSVGLIPENELSKSAGVDLSNITSGPIVNDLMETNVQGIFACGNVVHVHDLVDNVSKESIVAGKGAAGYLKNTLPRERFICVSPEGGARYVVPQSISLDNQEESVKLYFRVDRIYKPGTVVIKQGERVIKQYKRMILTPGEMEHIEISKKDIDANSSLIVEVK